MSELKKRADQCDVLVVGGGVTGCMIFRELCRYKLRATLLEKGTDLANGATMANSAIIHAGFDPHPGTRKAEFNVKGSLLYPSFAKELDFLYSPRPSLVLSFSETEDETVEALRRQGEEYGVPGLRVLEREELRALEPNLSQKARRALFAPSSAIVEPWGVAITAAENAVDNGGLLSLGERVIGIEREGGGFLVHTGERCYRAAVVVNAAGVYADEIHNMVCPPSFSIHGRKGHYFVLDRPAEHLVRNILFPCPGPKGKGILITPAIHHRILLGPDSETVPDAERGSAPTEAEALARVKSAVGQMLSVPIPFGQTIRSFAGVRPTSDRHDFIIGEDPSTPGFIDAAGIESPGLASAPAVGRHVASLAAGLLGAAMREDFNPLRRKQIRLSRMGDAERAELMKRDPGYARIVCKCEKVSEAEVVDAIRRNAGARTVKAVKKRVGAGFGSCQGGFCQPSIVGLLARELNIGRDEVLYDGPGSEILVGRTKEGGEGV